MEYEVELGPKMLALTERERKFVWFYLLGLSENGRANATEAARQAGYADPGRESSAIRVRSHALMHSDRVRGALREVAERHFEGLVLESVLAAQALIANPKHRDHARMVTSVLSSLGFGEVSRVRVEGEIKISHTDAAVEDLRRLKALGVPREKLLEVFGFSGLDRYEALLATQEPAVQEPKLIEGKVENAS